MTTRFVKYLNTVNLFSPTSEVELDRLKQLFYTNQITYRQLAIEFPKIYVGPFKGKTVTEIHQAAKFFASEIITNSLYPYAVELVHLMNQHSMTIALSGSPQEVIQIVGAHLGFNLIYGTELEVIEGVYTGRLIRNLIPKEGKAEVFRSIVNKFDIDLRNSFGFGDTGQDVAFLEKVGTPVAVNPNPELLMIAQKKGWIICQSEDTILHTIKQKIT